ncbi:MAG: sigma-54-dependent Fis family transcriptional regulator [Planctomycetota bacterium]|jgi:transcriptional regulator with GAF, ATPase, and Fis domain
MAIRNKQSDAGDIKNSHERQGSEECIRFEKLLSVLSATFINLPSDEIDKEIEHGLELIVRFLGADRGVVWQFSEDQRTLNMTHSYTAHGVKPAPVTAMPPGKRFLWYAETLRNGEMVVLENLPDDLPEQAVVERQFCIEQGLKSHLAIPLSMGKASPIGVIGFGYMRGRQTWPVQWLRRVQFIGHILSFALMRKRSEKPELKRAFAEIKELKEHFEAEINEEVKAEYCYGEILGHSNAIKNVMSQVEQVASTDATVLIQGETGTGKELLARTIHQLSPRSGKAMVRVNCAAIPPTLIESELFGHEKGAYTGALSKQVGRFEIADGGTIFLDEIGELPGDLQAKLLHVLEENRFERVGSPETISVDIRVIAATNKNLAASIRDGDFREDLYYRLNVFPVEVPPLRQRKEDIPMLVWSFVQEFSDKMARKIEVIPRKAMEQLQSYTWPGNVRELRNIIERAMILTKGTSLYVDMPKPVDSVHAQSMGLEEFEKHHIIDILSLTGWRVRGKNGAAELLQLKPSTLESKMQKLGIKRPK